MSLGRLNEQGEVVIYVTFAQHVDGASGEDV